MVTAKSRAIDVLRRDRTARRFAPELGYLLQSEWTLAPAIEECFASNAIQDDQLRMMFTCCPPKLPEEARVALILHILCGFSVDEVATAFMSTHAAMEKRSPEPRRFSASSKRLFAIADATDFTSRLPAVQRALYLLFNEGYHGASSESSVRTELCQEAMRLAACCVTTPGRNARDLRAGRAHGLHAARLPGRLEAGDFRVLR